MTLGSKVLIQVLLLLSIHKELNAKPEPDPDQHIHIHLNDDEVDDDIEISESSSDNSRDYYNNLPDYNNPPSYDGSEMNECEDMAPEYFCEKNVKEKGQCDNVFGKKHCMKTCGHCDPPTTSRPTPGPTIDLPNCPLGRFPSLKAHHRGVRSMEEKVQSTSNDVEDLNWEELRHDLEEVMTTSQPHWPADYGNYGPLFIRLAWHAAGSYRKSDGRGGSDGGRMRFDPERSWDDNTNLDKARGLLLEVKLKHGAALSWADLIIFAGNVAIELMGLKLLGFCAGRIDDEDGSESIMLGPSPEQEELYPCPTNGECKPPLGTRKVGLIYVNPEGPMGNPNPTESAKYIRDVFGRMGMNDSESVALIGGGHAWGKCHGACKGGPGKKPMDDPINSWQGTCGSGRGKDTFTSGFELPWTTRPTRWDNEYFKSIMDLRWEKHRGPGGKWQWKVRGSKAPTAPRAENRRKKQPIGMLTSDIALKSDSSYKKLSHMYANDLDLLSHDFKYAWYKLTTRDMGPHSRCVGPNVPPPQAWQYPLPDPVAQLADFDQVKDDVMDILNKDEKMLGKFTRLAWRCSATFRKTDYLGGCNGARIRFSPQKEWAENKNLDEPLLKLKPIKIKHGEGLSWADLIILAANTAFEKAGVKGLDFCPGRTDAVDDDGASSFLKVSENGEYPYDPVYDKMKSLMERVKVMGLTQREFAVLNAAGYALGDPTPCQGIFCRRVVPDKTCIRGNDEATKLTNKFFIRLLKETWESYPDKNNPTTSATGMTLYKSHDSELFMFASDIWYKYGELRVISEEYYKSNKKFLSDFAMAWTKLTTADRFDGPKGNKCRKNKM